MFVRQKKNPSGIISVQVIDKSLGTYTVLYTVGSSADPNEVGRLVQQGKEWIKRKLGQLELDLYNEKAQAEQYLDQIEQIRSVGPDLLLGHIYDEIGFAQLEDEILKKLVDSRICFPLSKLKTSEYLDLSQAYPLKVGQIYRYMDELYKSRKEPVQQISYQHTCQILNQSPQIVFYDVTTLYFEIDREDELRKTGFSKEGKHQHPQIVLGLLVSIDGYPLAYEIFEGNKFEGHTMMPVLEGFKRKYQLKKLVVVADSGLLSRANIGHLQEEGYEFILGARLKQETREVQQKVLALRLENGQSAIVHKPENLKLIVTYSDKRAKKDAFNRDRGLKRLEKKNKSGKLGKSSINNRGYNKYLKLEGEMKVSIDYEKFQEDAQWDGLKGYLTNSQLPKEKVVQHYQGLWKIERAFRITKTDLRIRPVFHYLQRRIEAHICIAFVAYKVYKELERQLKEKQSEISPDKAIEIAKTIYSIRLITPNTKEIVEKIIIKTKEQRQLTKLFNCIQ